MRLTYFVHTITTDNEAGLATGWLPGELSAEGVRRAKALQLDATQFDAIFCSDLARAVASAKLFFGHDQPLFLDWRLRECNYGDFDGHPAKEFKKDKEAAYINAPYPGGESYVDVERRMRSFLADAVAMYPQGHIAVVAHQAPQLALDVIVKQMTWAEAIADDWRRRGAWQPGWEYTFAPFD